MRSILQFASLATFSGLVLMGCSTTATTQEKSKLVKMHAVSAQGISNYYSIPHFSIFCT